MYRSLPTLLLLLGLCFRNTIAYHTSLQLQDSHAPSSQTLSAYVQKYLRPSLSPRASLSLPNSATFQNLTTRWSTFTDSKIGMVVEVAEAQDVAVAVRGLYPIRMQTNQWS